jgi:hypothetical protein
VPLAFPPTRGNTKSRNASLAKNTREERQIVSSLTMRAILLGGIVLTLSLVLGSADPKKTALGAIGKTIKQVG